MSKATIQAEVIAWLHNDNAAAQQDVFWQRAKDAISGDVYGIDVTVAGWEDAHCTEHPSLWFYAALSAGHIFTRDAEGLATAAQGYQAEVARVGTSPALRGTRKQMTRPYGGKNGT